MIKKLFVNKNSVSKKNSPLKYLAKFTRLRIFKIIYYIYFDIPADPLQNKGIEYNIIIRPKYKIRIIRIIQSNKLAVEN